MTRQSQRRRKRVLRVLEIFFWCAAALLLGAYSLVYLDRNVYQAYEAWAFEQEVQHESAPVLGFVLHSLRFGRTAPAPSPTATGDSFVQLSPAEPVSPRRPLSPGALIGRIEIPRIDIRAMVVDGTSDASLRRAVGHIDGTPLPGEPGNIGLAGHRDTFFRGLRNVRREDVIRVRTLDGAYEYAVDSIRIVGPDDVEVLNASTTPTLTLVTCYPFDYFGAAPLRFIVQARLISGPGATQPPPRGS